MTPALACLLALAAAAPVTRHGGGKDDPALRGTLAVLAEAIHRLASPGSNYRHVLRSARAGVEGEAGVAIDRFLDRAPPAGAEFPCSPDFLRLRARQTLLGLRNKLAGEEPARAQPSVCYAIPFALDSARLEPIGELHIYGLDFDAAPLQMVLIDGGAFQDVTARLTQASHDHLVFRPGPRPKGQALALVWGHLIRYSIPIVGPSTSLCSSRVELVPARTITLSPPSRPWADALLDYSDNLLEATLCTSGGCEVNFLYTTDPDRVIDGVVGELKPRVATVQAASAATLTARLGPIALVSSENAGCLSPVAYLEAKRAGVLSPATREALDRQLARVDPAVLRVRPRFVPLQGTHAGAP